MRPFETICTSVHFSKNWYTLPCWLFLGVSEIFSENSSETSCLTPVFKYFCIIFHPLENSPAEWRMSLENEVSVHLWQAVGWPGQGRRSNVVLSKGRGKDRKSCWPKEEKHHHGSKSWEEERCGNVALRGGKEKDKERDSRVRGKNWSKRQGTSEVWKKHL